MAARFESWIGSRYVRARSSNSFVSLISAISMLGIAIAVVVSLLVAVSILPLAAKQWLPEGAIKDHNRALWHRITNGVMRLTSTPRKRWSLVTVLIGTPLLTSYLLLPELDYLPVKILREESNGATYYSVLESVTRNGGER